MRTIQDELDEWFRPVSPLVAFAKSVRGEGGAQDDDPSKAAKGEYIDPLQDEDISELPTSVQEKLKLLRTDHRKQYDTNVELEQRRKAAEDFGRNQQARADKVTAIVRAHNLPIEGQSAGGGNRTSSADAKIAEIQAKLQADGLPEAQAIPYAKMLASAGDIERDRMLQEMAPLFGAVNTLQAQQALGGAQVKFKQVFEIPELNKAILDNVQVLLSQGKPVDEKTMEHLVSMAWGQYALANPDALKKKDPDVNTNFRVPSLGSNTVTTGAHRSSANTTPANGAPAYNQPETPIIMDSISKFMRADLPKKGAK